MEEEEKKGGWKALSFVFFIFAVGLLAVYWFVPFGTIEFESKSNDFSLVNQSEMQFYHNLRYSDSEISYRIYDCPLKKKNDMEEAFEIIANQSVLSFSPVDFQEDIFVTCDSKNKLEGGLFVAGEGGPVKITKGDNFNVILKGEVLLIRSSECKNPNIAIHELLHALGFNHSENSNNIMYPVSKCNQEIGSEIFGFLNKLYSTPSEPDIVLGNVSAVMRGKYLDVNVSVKNDGLRDSEEAEVQIYADDKLVKTLELDAMKIGYGRVISLSNLWVGQVSVDRIDVFINSSFSELEKNNNRISLRVK